MEGTGVVLVFQVRLKELVWPSSHRFTSLVQMAYRRRRFDDGKPCQCIHRNKKGLKYRCTDLHHQVCPSSCHRLFSFPESFLADLYGLLLGWATCYNLWLLFQFPRCMRISTLSRKEPFGRNLRGLACCSWSLPCTQASSVRINGPTVAARRNEEIQHLKVTEEGSTDLLQVGFNHKKAILGHPLCSVTAGVRTFSVKLWKEKYSLHTNALGRNFSGKMKVLSQYL